MRLTKSAFILLLFLCALVPSDALGQMLGNPTSELAVHRAEHVARAAAVAKAVPTYPAEALERGVEGIIEVRVGVNSEGEVVKVKVPPHMNPLFKESVAAAARLWKFKPLALQMPPGKYLSNRLTFRFYIKGGKGRVELYKPEPHSAGWVRMGSSARTVLEWEEWEEVPDPNATPAEEQADPQ